MRYAIFGILAASFFPLAVPAHAEAEDGVGMKMETLTTKDGREFTGVTLTAKRPDGISIAHESGATRLAHDQLPDELAEMLGGFDAEEAAAARANDLRQEAALRMAIERDLKRQQALEADTKIAEAKLKNARRGYAEVVQALENGALCKIGWEIDRVVTRTTKDAFGRDVVTKGTRKAVAPMSKDWIYIEGLVGVVDGNGLGVALERNPEPYVYTTATGARKTVAWYHLLGSSSDGR